MTTGAIRGSKVWTRQFAERCQPLKKAPGMYEVTPVNTAHSVLGAQEVRKVNFSDGSTTALFAISWLPHPVADAKAACAEALNGQ